jgi:hypothetical protein
MPINWQQVIMTFLATVGGGGAVLAAAAWLIKTLVANRLALDAEKFKMEMKAKSDAEIERLKNALQMAALEHQVRFSKLHEKRAEVVAKLYALLVELQYAGQRYVFVGGYEPKRDDEFSKSAAKVHEVFLFIEEHQVYLPDRVCTLLAEFVETVNKSVAGVQVYDKYTDGSANFRREKIQVLKGAAEAFEKRIPAVREALKDEFRTILGVDNSHPQENQI